MDLFKKLVLLSSLLVLASCNETISPELQNGGVITPPDDSGPTIPETEYYFRLTNTAPAKLNYLLHKTGDGNKDAKCELTSQGVPFSKATYKPNNDITCFLEAEELSLYSDGLSLAVEASPKTCDFVAYKPFSYYNRPAGDSTGTYEFATCTPDYIGTLPPQGCGNAVSVSILGLNSFPIPESPEELCRFNYNDKEQCDVGTITVVEKNYTMVDNGGTMEPTVLSSTQKVECGGKVRSCVQGPYTIERENFDFPPNGGIYYTFDVNEKFLKEYEYPGLIKDRRSGNYVYANYRRNLANYNIDYVQDDGSVPYKQAFEHVKEFHPQVMASYALDGMNFLSHHGVTVPNSEANTYSAKPFAADPFMGIFNYTPPFIGDYSVQPFYTYECLDTAMEIKARIRLVVRDWDRIRSPDPNLADDVELISDIFRIPEGYVLDRDLSGNYYPWSRQDNNTNDPDSDIPGRDSLNNRLDWDDIIKMSYLGLPAIGSRGYVPVDGFFSEDIFPREDLEKDD